MFWRGQRKPVSYTHLDVYKRQSERSAAATSAPSVMCTPWKISYFSLLSLIHISAVTKQAGCTRSLFYHYFADMDTAVTAVMDEAIDGFIAELEQWRCV